MTSKTQRAKYEAPKLEVQPLRELPAALAGSGGRNCRPTQSKGMSCAGTGK